MIRLAAIVLVLLFGLPTDIYAGFPDGKSGRGHGGIAGYLENTSVTSVSATWQVPLIQYDPTQSRRQQILHQWVGVQDQPFAYGLIQAGVIESFSDGMGTFQLYPFYECYCPMGTMCSGEKIQPIAQTVRPFDIITSTLACATNCTAGSAAQTWNIMIRDATQNWAFTLKGHACRTGLSQAFEVVETQNGPIPNFGSMAWENVTINGVSAGLRTSQELYLYRAGLNPGATINPSDPNATRDGFRLCWGDSGTGGARGPYTNCPNDPSFGFRPGQPSR